MALEVYGITDNNTRVLWLRNRCWWWLFYLLFLAAIRSLFLSFACLFEIVLSHWFVNNTTCCISISKQNTFGMRQQIFYGSAYIFTFWISMNEMNSSAMDGRSNGTFILLIAYINAVAWFCINGIRSRNPPKAHKSFSTKKKTHNSIGLRADQAIIRAFCHSHF